MPNKKLYNLCNIPIFQTMTKKIIQTDKAPAPIGPYSQAVLVNNMLYVSGQIAINPANGQLVLDNIIEETQQVMNNLKAILEAAGMDFSNVIKSTIFLKDMNQFSSVNEIYGAFFKSDFPARETVQVAALPKFVNVEISVVASM
jgi:2-iminobutanoate/2-iminopropanoate deaminase